MRTRRNLVAFVFILAFPGCGIKPSGGRDDAPPASTGDAVPAVTPAPAAATAPPAPAAAPPPLVEAPVAAVVATVVGEQASTDLLGARRFAAPAPLLLNAAGLKTVYTRVFGAAAPRGVKTSGYFLRNPTEIFTPQQKAVVGEFNVNAFDVTIRRSQWATVHTQEYHRHVREFLADACLSLTKRERAAVATANKLVRRSGVPTAADIDAFMAAMFGYEAPAGTLHQGAADYEAAFAAGGDAATAEELYVLLCVAVGNDPRVYLR